MLHRDDSSSRMWLRRGLHLLPGDSKLVIREGGGGNYLDLSLLQGPPRHIPRRCSPQYLIASPWMLLDQGGRKEGGRMPGIELTEEGSSLAPSTPQRA